MAANDLIHFDRRYCVFICKSCKSCFPTTISRHIQYRHNRRPRKLSRQELDAIGASFYTSNLQAVTAVDQIRSIQPAKHDAPVDILRVHYDGIVCLFCNQSDKPYICCSWGGMRHHLAQDHQRKFRGRGGPYRRPASGSGSGCPDLLAGPIAAGLVRAPVICQTFFASGGRARYFEVSPVLPPPAPRQSASQLRRGSVGSGGSDGGGMAIDDAPDIHEGGPAATLRQQIELELELAVAEAEGRTTSAATDCVAIPSGTSEQSRWLQLTEWTRFLTGHSLQAAACLLDASDDGAARAVTSTRRPSPPVDSKRRDDVPSLHLESPPSPSASPSSSESVLAHILDALDRVVQRARQSLADGRLNTFDQHQLNSFLAGRPTRKPLLHQLQERSYDRYVRVFRKLLCFVYRRAWGKQGPELPFRATDNQLLTLADLIHAARTLEEAVQEELDEDFLDEVRKRLDDACLLFCIALLDHPLYGDIYESLVVGFFAVLAIEEPRDGSRPRLSEAVNYTTHLSAFVKISQLLVAERALLAVERDEADYPAHALEAMQRRFIVEGTRSPMCWARKIRAYGKAIKDTTTSVGHIAWSDDNEMLLYKETRFTMTQLRSLVRTELELAQDQLSGLLLVHSDEDRQAVVSCLSLRSLLDNPSEARPGWSFLQHPDNTALHRHETWVLDRVLENRWLRNDFFQPHAGARWRGDAVRRYLADVDAFLERLLLLVHITGGQPAKGTELLAIQHCNPADGQGRRNIFLENGLVSFVIFYHKGYSVTGSTKIIHRFLPLEVSELLVYYFWLVLPFVGQLDKLSRLPEAKAASTSYLWGAPRKETTIVVTTEKKKKSKKKTTGGASAGGLPVASLVEPWPSTRLASMLGRELQRLVNTKVNIQTWRHAAIAISRRHLRQARFKRDFIEAVTWA